MQGGPPGYVDAGPDATLAPGADDGGGDAQAVDAGFCASLASPPRLCADFDEGQPVDTGWTLDDTTPNATVAIDYDAGYSPPSSMRSAITTGDVPASARLQEFVPIDATHVHMEMEMLLPTGGGPFELIALHELTADLSTYGFFYKQEQGSLLAYVGTLEADGGVVQSVYQIGKPPATWVHVEIDIDIGDVGNVYVKHDGVTVVSAPSIPTATSGRKQLFVELGFYSPNAATANVDFDNVVVDWK